MRLLSGLIVCILVLVPPARGQDRLESALRIARVKYSGGGDWYNDPSAELNLLRFVRGETSIDVAPGYEFVELTNARLFSYPLLFLTGHGNISFSEAEIRRLRSYLLAGGFLYADDDYGMNTSFRREMKAVFPEKDFVELPFDHGLFHAHFDFPNGVPKTHEHDNKPPQGFALFDRGRMIVLYTYESNPSDGWADPEIHGDPPAVREDALRFGTNIIVWVLSH